MTGNVLPPRDPVVQTLAAGIVDAIRRDPQLREELREILLTGESDAWVDQAQSQLGRRRHRAAVRAAVEAGDDRARIVGRRHLMRRDLYETVLLQHGRAQVAMAVEREAATDSLAAELGLEVVA